MARRTQTVRQLADEVRRDYEEVLLTLWEADIHYLDDIDSMVSSRDMARARRVLGIPSPAELKSTAYWQSTLGMDATTFAAYLESLGIEYSNRARKLPKGALKRLRQAQARDPAAAVP